MHIKLQSRVRNLNNEDKQILILERKLDMAIHLLKKSKPYIERHYEYSAAGFGKHALTLMQDMHDFIESVIKLRNENGR
jgi:hypothetical protein